MKNRLPIVISVTALVVALLGVTSLGGAAVHATATAAKGPLSAVGLTATAKVGPRGPRGFRGRRGPAGPAGPTGPQGIQGIQGIQGVQGLKGDPGVGPIAYGYINADGTVSKATSNVSSSWDNTLKRYVITITGENYYFASYATVVTPTENVISHTSSVGGNLLVYFQNTAGTGVQTANGFQFVTYKP